MSLVARSPFPLLSMGEAVPIHRDGGRPANRCTCPMKAHPVFVLTFNSAGTSGDQDARNDNFQK